jgi:hypothetical protein
MAALAGFRRPLRRTLEPPATISPFQPFIEASVFSDAFSFCFV